MSMAGDGTVGRVADTQMGEADALIFYLFFYFISFALKK